MSKKILTISVIFALLFSSGIVRGSVGHFYQFINNTGSNFFPELPACQGLGTGNDEFISSIDLWLRLDGEEMGTPPQYCLELRTGVEVLGESCIPYYEEDKNQPARVWTFDFSEPIRLESSKDYNFCVVSTGMGFYIYGSATSTAYLYGEATGTWIGDVEDVYFETRGGSLLPFTSSFTAGLMNLIGEVFTDLAPVLAIGLGISLALTYVIPKIIGLLRIKRGGI